VGDLAGGEHATAGAAALAAPGLAPMALRQRCHRTTATDAPSATVGRAAEWLRADFMSCGRAGWT